MLELVLAALLLKRAAVEEEETMQRCIISFFVDRGKKMNQKKAVAVALFSRGEFCLLEDRGDEKTKSVTTTGPGEKAEREPS